MAGVHYVTEPDAYLEPRISTTDATNWPATTVIEIFKNIKNKFPSQPALSYKRPVNGKLPATYTVLTYEQYWNECMKFAKCLLKYNVSPFKIVNILGFNSHEWFIANTGAILAGCIAAGIYSTNNAEACKYITDHSKAEVVVVEGNKQLEKYAKVSLSDLPHLQVIVVYAEEPDKELVNAITSQGKQVMTWEAFMNDTGSVTDAQVEERWPLVRPGNCVSLIYTSGTTGPPKAVMISHDNITWTVRCFLTHYDDLHLSHKERIISYLPLSHIAAQLFDIHLTMFLGASVTFAQPDALKGTLTITMKEACPTLFFGVPRVWEKIQEKMVQMGRSSTGIKKQLATYAKQLGLEKSKRAQYGAGGGTPTFFGCMNSLVLSKVKAALGLQDVKACFTGAAAIAAETIWYFASLDIPILEVFGQSECTAPHSTSTPKLWKVGYCGRPLNGTESKLAEGTQELCYRGRHIFMGYMHMPRETADAIDEEGYLHSGDVAEFDKDGFMKITGRIKELIITAGGENIPPVLIENEVKQALDAVAGVLVVGEKKKFLACLLSLKVELDPENNNAPTDKLAPDALLVGKQIKSDVTLYSQAMLCPLWKAYIDAGIKKANQKATSNAQKLQKWDWLPEDFSEKGGDLTPTLKLKRNVVTKKYEALIDAFYVEDAASKDA